ncbi:MAG: hypothetical protein JNL94_00120 [Planctomycetes bacterium]|nr:hypothetical protein [Planctomycetota bacterium]
MTSRESPRTGRIGRTAVVVAVVGVLAWCVWSFGFRTSAIDLGPATWFVVSPSGRVIAVGRPDGSLAIVDSNGNGVDVASWGSANDGIALDRADTAYIVEGGDGSAAGSDGVKRSITRRRAGDVATTSIDVPVGTRLVPVVDGARERGPLERDARRMLLALRTSDRVAGLKWLELETLAITDVPFALDGEIARDVTAMPGQQGFTLLCAPADLPPRSGPIRLRVFDATGAPLHVVSDAAPVMPYWLPDTGTLLFERAAGGISRFHPPDGKPVWVCDGRFTDVVDRGYIAVRDLTDAWVLVEKTDGDGYVQVAQIWPFESGARRTRNLTTGLVHKFGLAVSFDHRFLAFRQVDGKVGLGAVDERVVLVDQSASYRSSTVVERRVDPAARDIGPEFPATEDVVLFVDRDRLWKSPVE